MPFGQRWIRTAPLHSRSFRSRGSWGDSGGCGRTAALARALKRPAPPRRTARAGRQKSRSPRDHRTTEGLGSKKPTTGSRANVGQDPTRQGAQPNLRLQPGARTAKLRPAQSSNGESRPHFGWNAKHAQTSQDRTASGRCPAGMPNTGKQPSSLSCRGRAARGPKGHRLLAKWAKA